MTITYQSIIRILSRGILIGIVLYICLCIFVFFIQKSLIFFPSKEIFPLPSDPNLTEVSMKTEDNISLNGWYLDNKSEKTVIFFHGNGGNIFYNRERLAAFNGLPVNALMIDYRGYGKSEGSIQTEEDLFRDGDAAYKYILEKNIDPKNIIIWGQSLGGSIAIYLAQNKNISATIIESSFYSMKEMAAMQYGFLPTNILLRFQLRSDEKIANITSPVIIIHSRDDEMIPLSQGKKLFEKIKSQKYFLETRGTHNGGFQKSYDLYMSALKILLQS